MLPLLAPHIRYDLGGPVSILSAFYDLFVGVSSFAAGWVAHQWGYGAAFVMAAVALVAAAIAGRSVFFETRGQTRHSPGFGA